MDFLITQVVLDWALYRTFRQKLDDLKILLPVLPGLFLFKSARDLDWLRRWCNVDIPRTLQEKVEQWKTDDLKMKALGMVHTVDLIRYVCENELAVGVHIFCLNKLELVQEVRQQTCTLRSLK